MSRDSRVTVLTLAAFVLVLAVVNVWVHVDGGRRVPTLVTRPLVAVLLLAMGAAAGLSWAQLGIGSGALGRSALWGGVCAALVAAGYAVALAVPRAHPLFLDPRHRLGPASALVTAFVAVPLGTVVLEEVAFRGVLWGLLEREHGGAWATAVSSLLFGLWHVLPALDAVRSGAALSRTAGGGRPLGTVVATVAFTAAAGVPLAGLRWWTGGLLAPILLHWAINACGVLASARVWAISDRQPGPAA